MTSDRKDHWESVYANRPATQVSWFEESPAMSLELLDLAGVRNTDAIVDVGGGASRLVDSLLDKGFRNVTVLDLSNAALSTTRKRLGAAADQVRWIAGDATRWEPRGPYDVWHDRAAFHFLTEGADQAAYLERLRQSLRPGGVAIFGTFSPEGPEKCSGLPVVRHDSNSLSGLLGDDFELLDARTHDHLTPSGAVQKFQFSTFRRRGTASPD